VGERKGWKNGERWEKMRETGDKGKKGEKGERKEKSGRILPPCPPPHRFRDSFCLFGITNAHHTPVI
jgi:hypothetical protein